MALSDYERRVLDEIESELSHAPRRRWSAAREACFAMRWAILAAAALVGLVVGLAFVILPTAAISVALACGCMAGFVLGYSWRRCRGWLRGR
jgi:hypothetical protein